MSCFFESDVILSERIRERLIVVTSTGAVSRLFAGIGLLDGNETGDGGARCLSNQSKRIKSSMSCLLLEANKTSLRIRSKDWSSSLWRVLNVWATGSPRIPLSSTSQQLGLSTQGSPRSATSEGSPQSATSEGSPRSATSPSQCSAERKRAVLRATLKEWEQQAVAIEQEKAVDRKDWDAFRTAQEAHDRRYHEQFPWAQRGAIEGPGDPACEHHDEPDTWKLYDAEAWEKHQLEQHQLEKHQRDQMQQQQHQQQQWAAYQAKQQQWAAYQAKQLLEKQQRAAYQANQQFGYDGVCPMDVD